MNWETERRRLEFEREWNRKLTWKERLFTVGMIFVAWFGLAVMIAITNWLR